MKIARLFAIFAAISVAGSSFGQILISSTGAAITENFNSLGTTSTASLPSNWRMTAAGDTSASWNDVANVSATTAASNSGTPTAGGRYNWGDSDLTSDRAIGFMTSGGYASPNSIMAFYQNATGATVDSIYLSFDIERYRQNTASAQVNLFYSTDGSSWTAAPTGDVGAATIGTGTNLYNFAVSGTTFTSTFSKSITLSSLNLANAGSLYLRWNFNTTGANSQGLGLDNVSLTANAAAVPEPSTYAAIIGAVALVGAAVHRRRQRGKAATV